MSQIFVCEACDGDRCILHTPDDVDLPTGCPWPGGEVGADWRRMVTGPATKRRRSA